MLSDVVFVILAIVHLFIREWPFGDGMQRVMDVLFLLGCFLIISKYIGRLREK